MVREEGDNWVEIISIIMIIKVVNPLLPYLCMIDIILSIL